MNKKLILVATSLIVIVIISLIVYVKSKQSNPKSISPLILQTETKNIKPSETLKEYSDPSGFTLSYPDNLSLTKNDVTNENTYADIQLNSKDISGSLNLKISDSKFATLDEWIKLNKGSIKEIKLGSLNGIEILTSDRLLLGVLDKNIFFTIEVPLLEKDFWQQVYNKVLTTFSFAATSPEDVSFESEEVVE
ncbi:MAG: hypothetical protein Q8Q91_00675 [Candidatus Daviesbacteria bacterium]|nr:hypothetical protein [Candidatus Daviesbacteria bacterium]